MAFSVVGREGTFRAV